jgi:hypothetical protein
LLFAAIVSFVYTIASGQEAGAKRNSFGVVVDVTAPDDIQSRASGSIKRQLRERPDLLVVNVETNHTWEISVVILKTEAGGYVAAVAHLSPATKLISALAKEEGIEAEKIRKIVEPEGQEPSFYIRPNLSVMAYGDLDKLCTAIVDSFDEERVDPIRRLLDGAKKGSK